jgi:hypothetical protein
MSPESRLKHSCCGAATDAGTGGLLVTEATFQRSLPQAECCRQRYAIGVLDEAHTRCIDAKKCPHPGMRASDTAAIAIAVNRS